MACCRRSSCEWSMMASLGVWLCRLCKTICSRCHGTGLDQGIGHLALARPQRNEQSIPIEVATRGRPRHPSPSSYQGQGLLKEVAVSTVFQAVPPINHRSQPRWDRFERADLFAQYQTLRAQGVSERQAAKELKVPRTTLQAWRVWHDTLDSCPQVADFFQSGPGLAFFHRLGVAFHLVCVEVGACGIRLVCLWLHLTG